jgi:hypothetical protein
VAQKHHKPNLTIKDKRRISGSYETNGSRNGCMTHDGK